MIVFKKKLGKSLTLILFSTNHIRKIPRHRNHGRVAVPAERITLRLGTMVQIPFVQPPYSVFQVNCVSPAKGVKL